MNKSGDLISRWTAIEYLMTNMGWQDENGYTIDDADEKRAIITDLVNGIPAVDAVPVIHAKWVEETDHSYHWFCSNCKQVWGMTKYFMKFCPSCGALIDSEE